MSNNGAALRRKALFEIPIWSIDLATVVPHHAEMATEVDQLIDKELAQNTARVLAHQTVSDPFALPSDGWRVLERATNRAYSELAQTQFQRWRDGEFHIRRWAIRLGRLSTEEKARLERDQVHNHLPALFSTVYFLRIPSAIAGVDGGTRFWNPLGNLMDVTAPRLCDVPALEGRLLIFPSFLDHAPIPVDWDAEDDSRLVISSDLFYVSGISAAPHDARTVIAAGRELPRAGG